MTRGTLVLLGNLAVERRQVDGLAVEFGWSVEAALNLDHLQQLSLDRNIVAVLLDVQDLCEAWMEVLESLQEVAPGALPIVCQRFSEQLPWPELAEAGAFHMLSLPICATELRQSLGFVWAAQRRHLANLIRLDRAPRERTARALHPTARANSVVA